MEGPGLVCNPAGKFDLSLAFISASVSYESRQSGTRVLPNLPLRPRRQTRRCLAGRLAPSEKIVGAIAEGPERLSELGWGI